MMLTVTNASEERNIGTLACSSKFKWQNQAKKAELSGREKWD
jgi:hypothetical protein